MSTPPKKPAARTAGQFEKGKSGNYAGRPKKSKTVNEEIARALAEKVGVTENGKRRSVTKLSATAKQLANKGASGDLRAGKMVMEIAQRAEDQRRSDAPEPAPLTEADEAIVGRFLARQYRIWKENGYVPDAED